MAKDYRQHRREPGPIVEPTCLPQPANAASDLRTLTMGRSPSWNVKTPMDTDALHRPLRDVRLSVTDRCNFRCGYCMPREHFGHDHEFLGREHLLTFEEMTTLVKGLLPMGLEKVRITGGEPLLRRDLTSLIRMIRTLSSTLDLALTTNGSLLGQHAAELKSAGLNRVTVSLDAVDNDLFQQLADNTQFNASDVMNGIRTALDAGLQVKVNTVVKGGENESQILPIAKAMSGLDVPLRFIEFMDVGNTNAWSLDHVVSGEEIRSTLEQHFGELHPLPSHHTGEVARRFQATSNQEFGFIESVTRPFCGDCSRLRLSANGTMYTCLFASEGHELKPMLRMGATYEDITEAVRAVWSRRRDRYSMDRAEGQTTKQKVEMSFIGG